MARRPPPVIPVQPLTDDDVTLVIGDDPAYLAVIDVGSYETDLAEWDYDTLTTKLFEACPQASSWHGAFPRVRIRYG